MMKAIMVTEYGEQTKLKIMFLYGTDEIAMLPPRIRPIARLPRLFWERDAWLGAESDFP